MSLLYAGADIIFMDDPTSPPPGLAQLDNDVERQAVLRWITNENLGNCPLVGHNIINVEYNALRLCGQYKCYADH